MSTPNMNMTEPTDHGSSSVWGAALNACLDIIDAHDHTTGKGVQIPSAALKINADVSWSFAGTNYAVTDAKAIDFAETTSAAVTGYASALWVQSSDHNLYFRNSSGTNVQITSGSTLNVSIVGGIGGDYSSVGALFSFDDATDRYLAQQQGSPRPWAGIATGNIDLYQQAASIVNKVTLKSPSALGASYSVTWLAALPASQVLMQIDNTGQMTASNTLPNNTNLTLQGTGYIQRGPTEIIQCPLLGALAVTTAGTVTPQTGVTYALQAISTTAYYPLLGLNSKHRITQLVVNLSSAPAASVTYTLAKTPSVGAGGTAFADTTLTASGSSIATIMNNTTVQLDSTQTYWLKVVTDGTTQVRPMTCSIYTDVP